MCIPSNAFFQAYAEMVPVFHSEPLLLDMPALTGKAELRFENL